ncbi:LuxR C-terminal-related transcriptional regulator [Occultella kanbiaonis]|uniref:LuxR C-terminal-related transcriptional regulator n=1 Tax=Occultella kanbiaonis TaxID=2675754 RepID=UPI0013D50E2F|nr:LuxR C-terminal-related transcriptional regulator [Occultella kanbiaonis]
MLDRLVADRLLTLIEAPSGFGKTSLLVEWANQRLGSTAWLTLTRHDAHASQISAGLLTALLAVDPDGPHAGVLRSAPTDLHGEPSGVVDSIIEWVTVRQQPLTLVIDDAHLGAGSGIAEIIVPLVERTYGALHVVLAGTGSMRSWFTRQLVAGDASLLGAQELAFDVAEICAALQLSTIDGPERVDLAAQTLSETGGWPVAVQLRLRSAVPGAVAGQHDLRGVRLTEYIDTQVLSRLRPNLRRFVERATTADRLGPDLAQLLTGEQDSAALLEECVQTGLFLDSYQHDDGATVYQWHATFAHHCRSMQKQHDPDATRGLHATTADYLSRDYPAEAIVHALKAADGSLAVTIIEDNWLRMIIGGQAAVLAASCLRVPEPARGAPALLLIRACCLSAVGDRLGAELLEGQANTIMTDGSGGAEATPAIIRAFTALFLAHDQRLLCRAADDVKAALTGAPLGTTAYIHGVFLLGWTELRLRRAPALAVGLLTTAESQARAAGFDTLADRAVTNLAFALAFAGRLTASTDLIEENASRHARQADEWQDYDGGIELIARAFVTYWRNQLEDSLKHCLLLHESGGHPGSYSALGRIFFALSAAATRELPVMAAAERQLAEVSDTEMHGVPWHAYKGIARMSLAMARNERAEALAIAAPLHELDTVQITQVLLAEMYRRLAKPHLAVEVLHRIRKPRMVSFVSTAALVTTAAIAWERGDHVRAHRFLERSLSAAVPENIVRPFADRDEVILDLLTAHAAWGTAHEGFLAVRIGSLSAGINRNEILSVPLSRREREIFGYLCTPMTADEIAAKLYVSVNTIRTHQRAIYRKLGVKSRREAIRFQI